MQRKLHLPIPEVPLLYIQYYFSISKNQSILVSITETQIFVLASPTSLFICKSSRISTDNNFKMANFVSFFVSVELLLAIPGTSTVIQVQTVTAWGHLMAMQQQPHQQFPSIFVVLQCTRGIGLHFHICQSTCNKRNKLFCAKLVEVCVHTRTQIQR